MPAANSICIELVRFKPQQKDIMAIRKAVFIDELGIAPDLEWDNRDEQALYAIAVSDTTVIGIGRLLPDGQLGRIAVLPNWRRQGIGTLIMHGLLKAASQSSHQSVYLSAQLEALDFYAKQGFVKTGAPFIAAGLAHQKMYFSLPANNDYSVTL